MSLKQGIQHIILICLLAILAAIITLRLDAEPKAIPPEVNMDGLKTFKVVEIEETEPVAISDEPKMFFTEEDVIMVAKTIWGEAGSSLLTREEKASVAWVILNRLDDPQFAYQGNSISDMIAYPYQFVGYRESNPVTEECYEIAVDVLTRWSMEKNGFEVERELGKTFLYFTGDGQHNSFREVY